MADKLMSDAQLRRRRKVQGQIGRTTSTLGLTGLGVTGAAALAARKPGALKAVRKLPGLKAVTPEKMKNYAINTGIVSGGIGGIGGFNQASIYTDESRRKKQTTLKKGLDMDAGYYGEEGHQVKLPEIKVPVEKAWSPSAGSFDSEASRRKRAKGYENAALVGAGAGGAYTAHHGMHAAHAIGQARGAIKGIKTEAMQDSKGVVREVHDIGPKFAQGVKLARRHGGRAALGATAVAAAAGAHSAIKRKRKGSWQPYAKRAASSADSVSAFGVDHEVSKAINIKPENEGKFTASAKKAGKGIQEHAHAVVNSSKATELQRKRAQFAINARKWHH